MKASQFQEAIIPKLASRLNSKEVIGEWQAFQRRPYQYSPIVDIAVGPFSTTRGGNKTGEYNALLQDENISSFIQSLYEYHIENIGDERIHEIEIPNLHRIANKNPNARCFLSIEIENTSSKKHIMGSMINAASLGRIGIGIAYNESVKRAFVRILNYLRFLKDVGKNTYDASNFLIITKEQVDELLNV